MAADAAGIVRVDRLHPDLPADPEPGGALAGRRVGGTDSGGPAGVLETRVRLVHHHVPGLPDDLRRVVEHPDLPAVALYRMVDGAGRGRDRGGPAGMACRQD